MPVRRPTRNSATRIRRIDVTRAEFDSLKGTVIEILNSLTSIREDLGVQFTRIAQIQAELDRLHGRKGPRKK
jgi:hypothetical protein